jgi:septum formation protein
MLFNPAVILASASPRRKELLALLIRQYEIIPSTIDETALMLESDSGMPQLVVQELALAKARDVSTQHPSAIVIGADTIVVVDNEILGKPLDKAHAAEMLNKLNGRAHQVFTGIAVVNGNVSETDVVCTDVTFKQLTPTEIDEYILTGEPMDKAGSYSIQNRSISPVISVDGDYYNVVGLPIEALRTLLLKHLTSLPGAPSQPSI